MQAQDTTKTITHSAAKFFSGTMLSRITGMGRDMAMAAAFGTESAIATFMVAFRFAHLARRLFGEGTLQNTFIPHFEEIRAENPKKAFRFFRDLGASLLILLSGLILISIAVLLFALYLFEWSESALLLIKLTCIMLPSLLFISLYGINMALLECQKSFFTPSVAPCAFNIVWIIAALMLASFPPNTAVFGLAFAVILACFAQAAVTFPKTFTILKEQGGEHFFKQIAPFSADVKRLIGPLFLANLGVCASQINNALDPFFSLYANSEGPAWLWYAIRIQQLPLALFGVALAGALLPPISRAIKANDFEKFAKFFDFAFRKIAALTLVITAGIFATAPSAINVLFGHGQFNLESVGGTSLCLIGYGIGLFPMAYVLISAPILYAFNDFKTPTRAAIEAMLMNLALNALFIFLFGFGAESVAFATSIASLWNAARLHLAIQKKAETSIHLGAFFAKLGLIMALGMAAVFSFDLMALQQIPSLQALQKIPLELSQTVSHEIMMFSLEALVFVIACSLGAYFLKVEELTHLFRTREEKC